MTSQAIEMVRKRMFGADPRYTQPLSDAERVCLHLEASESFPTTYRDAFCLIALNDSQLVFANLADSSVTRVALTELERVTFPGDAAKNNQASPLLLRVRTKAGVELTMPFDWNERFNDAYHFGRFLQRVPAIALRSTKGC